VLHAHHVGVINPEIRWRLAHWRLYRPHRRTNTPPPLADPRPVSLAAGVGVGGGCAMTRHRAAVAAAEHDTTLV